MSVTPSGIVAETKLLHPLKDSYLILVAELENFTVAKLEQSEKQAVFITFEILYMSRFLDVGGFLFINLNRICLIKHIKSFASEQRIPDGAPGPSSRFWRTRG